MLFRSYVVMLFHNVPILNVWFTMLNVPVLLCAFIGSICEFYYTDYESCHSHHIVFRIFSISAALILPCILPVVLVFPLLGLFIHVVDLNSIMFKCSSSSVWLQFLC